MLISDPGLAEKVRSIAQLAGSELLELSGDLQLDGQIDPLILQKCEVLVVDNRVELPAYLTHIPKVVLGAGEDLQLPGDEVTLAHLLQGNPAGGRGKRAPVRGIAVVARWDLRADSWWAAQTLARMAAAVLVDCGGELPEWLPAPGKLTWEDLRSGDLPDGRTIVQNLPRIDEVPCLANSGVNAVGATDNRVADLVLRIPKNLVIHCGHWNPGVLRLCQAIQSRATLKCQVVLLGGGSSGSVIRLSRTLTAVKQIPGLTAIPVAVGKMSPEFRSTCAAEGTTYYRITATGRGRRTSRQLRSLWQDAYGVTPSTARNNTYSRTAYSKKGADHGHGFQAA